MTRIADGDCDFARAVRDLARKSERASEEDMTNSLKSKYYFPCIFIRLGM